MTPCPSCKNILVIDVNGNLQEQHEDQEPVELDAPVEEQDLENNVYEEASYEAEEVSEPEELIEQSEEENSYYNPSSFVTEEAAEEPVEEELEPESEGDSYVEEYSYEEPEEDSSEYDYEEQSELDEEVSEGEPDFEQVDTSESEDLSDIADYGNSELSMAKDGKFLYDIVISGIDSVELRDLVEENLTDQRLGVNVRGLMKMIEKGSLEIKRLNAIKASIIINRLKSLALSIEWRQNAITEVEMED